MSAPSAITIRLLDPAGATVAQATSRLGRASLSATVSSGGYQVVCTGIADASVTVVTSGAVSLTRTVVLAA